MKEGVVNQIFTTPFIFAWYPEPQLKILKPLKLHSIENPLISLITH